MDVAPRILSNTPLTPATDDEDNNVYLKHCRTFHDFHGLYPMYCLFFPCLRVYSIIGVIKLERELSKGMLYVFPKSVRKRAFRLQVKFRKFICWHNHCLEHATIFRNPIPTCLFCGLTEDCCMLSIPSHSAFLCLQFLSSLHPSFFTFVHV